MRQSEGPRPATRSWFSAWAIRCSSCHRSAVESPASSRSNVEFAVSGGVGVVVEYYRQPGAGRKLCGDVDLGQRWEVWHHFDAVSLAIDQTGNADPDSAYLAACILVVTKAERRFDDLSKQRIGPPLFGLDPRFLDDLTGTADQRALQRSSAKVDADED